MKVIVFGGAGFLGSHVADALTQAGHEVTVFDHKPSPWLQKGQHQVTGDILDEKAVNAAIGGMDIVYNFAGMADIDEAYRKPLEAVRLNVLGNTIILEASRRAGVKRFVFASSLYVYSKSGSFYRSSKQACEIIIENYGDQFALPYTILRYGSLYGPRAGESNGIFRFLRQAFTDRKITRFGDGNELREYIHVLDAAKGSVMILDEEFKGQSVIIAGHQQMYVKDLLLMIREMFDNKIDVEFKPEVNSYHYEITPYVFAPKVAKRLLCSTYHDLGQGILDCIYTMSREMPGAKNCEIVNMKEKT
jgi:UDP-glucose 4-epimerase